MYWSFSLKSQNIEQILLDSITLLEGKLIPLSTHVNATTLPQESSPYKEILETILEIYLFLQHKCNNVLMLQQNILMLQKNE